MPELDYRQSRVARVLGEPARWMILQSLLDEGPLRIPELASRVSRHPATVSRHLRDLRAVDLVRYESQKDGTTLYAIKYPGPLKAIVSALREFVQHAHRELSAKS